MVIKKTTLCIVIVSMMSGCFGVSYIDENHSLAEKFLGKTYCTKIPLFIWKHKEDQSRFFDIFKSSIHLPIDENYSLEKHSALAWDQVGFDQDWAYLGSESKLTIRKIFYYKKFISGISGYRVLAEIQSTSTESDLTDIGSLLIPDLPLKGDEERTRINERYLSICSAE